MVSATARILFSVVLVGALAAECVDAQRGPEVALDLALAPTEVTVTGVTPGGQLVLFSVARVPRGHSSSVSRRDEILSDRDGDGSVALEVEGGVTLRSVWAAVDLASGRAAFATPDGFPLELEEVPPGWLIGAGQGQAEGLTLPRDVAEVLAVRPAVGAWSASVFDGSVEDGDGPANNRVSPLVSSLRPFPGGPAVPDRLGPHDVVVVIDPSRLEVFASRLPEGSQP